jgi:hypothetical protein
MSLVAVNEIGIMADHVGRAIPDLRFSPGSAALSPNPPKRHTGAAPAVGEPYELFCATEIKRWPPPAAGLTKRVIEPNRLPPVCSHRPATALTTSD